MLASIQRILPLFIILPISFGVLSMLFHSKIKYYIHMILSITLFGISSYIAIHLIQNHNINFSYVFANINKQYGIELKANIYSFIMLSLLYIIYCLQAATLFNTRSNKNSSILDFSLLLIGSLAGLVLTNDIFNRYIFIELSSIISYALYTIEQKTNSIKATFDYLIINGVISIFILFGIFILYYITGNLNIDVIHAKLLILKTDRTVTAAYLLLTLLLLLKIGLYPMHRILFALYYNSNIDVAILATGTISKVYLFVTLQTVVFLFGQDIVLQAINFTTFFKIVGIFGFIVMTFNMIIETNIIKLILYMLFSQVSYTVLCLPLISSAYIYNSVILSLVTNSLSISAIISIISKIQKIFHVDKLTLSDFIFYIKKTKSYQFCFIAIILSLIGIPLTLGFTAKILMFFALVASGVEYFVIVGFLIGTLFTMISLLRIIGMILPYKSDNHGVQYLIQPEEGSTVHIIVLWFIVSILTIGNVLLFLIKI